MKIRLLTFASASDAVGAAELELNLEPGATVGSLKRLLGERHPTLDGLWTRLAIAVDGEISNDETALVDGAEVALLPPVSGGSPSLATSHRTRLTDRPISASEVVACVERPGSGAVLLFLGTVRDDHRGRAVARITYSAYREMAEQRLARIVDDLEAGKPDLRVHLVHRLGTLEIGEASVAIAVSSPHREASYRASRSALERIKAEVPIWKREHYADGEVAWREEEPLGSTGG